MKTRESGMQEEATWNGFFDPPRILERQGDLDKTWGHPAGHLPPAKADDSFDDS